MNIDDLAPPTGETFRFENIGDTVRGVITYVPNEPEAQTNKFNGNTEHVIRVVLDTDDGTKAIWPRVGSPMARAISDAVRTAGQSSLEVGGTLAVKFSETKDTGKPQHLKLFAAKYEAPARTAAVNADLF